MMTCQEFVDFLMSYLDEELDGSQRRSFERHIADCPPCVKYLESYRRTVEAGKSLCESPDAPVPDDVPENLVRAILAARRGE